MWGSIAQLPLSAGTLIAMHNTTLLPMFIITIKNTVHHYDEIILE
jgi:hypothetical protein